MSNKEVILQADGMILGGEKQEDGTWQFIYEDEVVHTWTGALRILSRYPWQTLSPVAVHPEFRFLVWREIEKAGCTLDKWRALCGIDEVAALADWIANSVYTVVLTGAGMSTESGVPDFRSQRGLWTKYDPFTVSHIDTLEKDYGAFQEFYSYRMRELKKVKPNAGHRVLARWQKHDIVKYLATQNVENLHQRAGSVNVAHLHGGLEMIRCHICHSAASKEAFIEKELCMACGGQLRPDIVLFGEPLPQDIWHAAFQEIEKSDLLLIIGTSLQVAPVNQLPRAAGGRVALINLDETPFDSEFDLVIRGKAAEVLLETDKLLRQAE
ncbi:MAG: NAD-dependent deacetylase [Ectobacillus sp.]